MTSFSGWSLPMEYIGLMREHENVRQRVGLFDVSHMGEIRLKGKKALESLEFLTTNHVSKLKEGRAQYSLILNEKGGVIDDVVIYCLSRGEDYLLCVNASNIEKDYKWILSHSRQEGVQVKDESEKWAQVAIQGPKAETLLCSLFPQSSGLLKAMRAFSFCLEDFHDRVCLLARTGYTGEDGFEVFVPAEKALLLWRNLLKRGKSLEVLPVGLGARNTLRLEMRYSLYGHEIHEGVSPYEANLGMWVKTDKTFIGQEALLHHKQRGIEKKLIAFEMLERGIPREKYKLCSDSGAEIGYVTSGAFSPSLKKGIGMGYVEKESTLSEASLFVVIRDRRWKAQIVTSSFVDPFQKRRKPEGETKR